LWLGGTCSGPAGHRAVSRTNGGGAGLMGVPLSFRIGIRDDSPTALRVRRERPALATGTCFARLGRQESPLGAGVRHGLALGAVAVSVIATPPPPDALGGSACGRDLRRRARDFRTDVPRGVPVRARVCVRGRGGYEYGHGGRRKQTAPTRAMGLHRCSPLVRAFRRAPAWCDGRTSRGGDRWGVGARRRFQAGKEGVRRHRCESGWNLGHGWRGHREAVSLGIP
jgi:hypothetical protein